MAHWINHLTLLACLLGFLIECKEAPQQAPEVGGRQQSRYQLPISAPFKTAPFSSHANWKKQPSLASEGRHSPETLKRIREAFSEPGIEQRFCLDALPLERRHNAGIDDPALFAMIQNHPGS